MEVESPFDPPVFKVLQHDNLLEAISLNYEGWLAFLSFLPNDSLYCLLRTNKWFYKLGSYALKRQVFLDKNRDDINKELRHVIDMVFDHSCYVKIDITSGLAMEKSFCLNINSDDMLTIEPGIAEIKYSKKNLIEKMRWIHSDIVIKEKDLDNRKPIYLFNFREINSHRWKSLKIPQFNLRVYCIFRPQSLHPGRSQPFYWRFHE